MRTFILFLMSIFFLTIQVTQAGTLFESGPGKTTLLELYSSEGCSSCPPAEVWISKLKKNPDLWKKFVPVVFHVDYWDYLGWPDSFATPAFTQRQRNYSLAWGKKGSVYTPGFVTNGKEWRGWFGGQALPESSTKQTKLLAILEAQQLDVTFESPEGSSPELEIALLGTDLNIDVQRGENGGKKLSHDFVVLHLDQKPWSKGPVRFNLPSETLAKATALAVWVRDSQSLEVLQSTGGWLKQP